MGENGQNPAQESMSLRRSPDLEQVLRSVRHHQRFLVTSHARPDGDAVGSVLALGAWLRALVKDADLVLADRVPLIYRNLPGADRIRQAPQPEQKYEVAILLECDSLERTQLREIQSTALVNIDHHTSGRPFADVNWIEPTASAVAEMVFELVLASGEEVTPAMATCLYAAVLTDTGSFCYEGVSARTFHLAEQLARHGAVPPRIAEGIYFANPPSKIRLLGIALATLQIHDRVASVSVTQQDMERARAIEEDCEGIVNYAIGIDGVRAAAFLREMPDGRFRLSLRSKGKVNVANVAQRFKGGGHANASGCTIDGPLEQARARIVDQLQAQLCGDLRLESASVF